MNDVEKFLKSVLMGFKSNDLNIEETMSLIKDVIAKCLSANIDPTLKKFLDELERVKREKDVKGGLDNEES